MAALGQAAGATLAAFSGAFLLQRVANFDKSLSRLRDGLALVVLGALGSALVSASIGTSVLYATRVHAYSGLGSPWLIYWLGDATGVLLVTPVALTLPRFLRIRGQARITELAVLFVLLTGVCFLVFGDPGLIPVRLHVLAFGVLPFVMWAAVRFGVTGAGLSVLLVATIATVETALGSGPFAASTPFTNAVLLDAFFAVLSVTGITLASVIAEREQAQLEREQSVREQGALEARLEAEQAVHASEERLRLAQQAARMGTFEWNLRTGVNTWTPELETMYGLPVSGFGGTQQAFENLVHPDDRAGVVEMVNSAFKTGEATAGEWRVVWPDGSVHWIAGRWRVFMNESGQPLRMVGVNMDVTERKQAEEALRQSEQRLRLAVQAGKMYVDDWDIAKDQVVRSEEFTNILGSTEPSHLTRKQSLAGVHPDDRERFIAAVDQLTPENPTTDIAYRVVRADGVVIWLEKHGRAFFDPQGRMLRMIGMVADVTERKQAEERLREYENAVEGAEDMIGVIDREYRYLLANRQYLKMRNLTREQVVGHFISEVLGREVFETAIKPKLDECFQGNVVKYEMKFSYPAVGERDLLLSYFPIEGVNGVDRAACILHDITDRRRAEEQLLEMNRALEAHSSQLRSSEELLKTFVKNVPAAVAMLDREMRYLQVSDRWCTDYLSGREQTVGRSHYEIFPDMPERWKAVHRRCLAGETLRADEDRWDGPDGPHWARWEVRPWKTAEGTVGGILILAEDITRRKQMEEALSTMSRKLIDSQEQERARIGRELHDDINQQIAMLAVELEQLQNNPSDVQNRLQELRKQMSELSNDVQALSHELHSSKLQYLGVVPGMRSWCREFSERQAMEIDFKSDVSSVVPFDVGICLFRVLQESLHNATKHSAVKHIEVQIRETSNEIHLIVTDLGKGFDVEAAIQGQGLGLTSIRERVRLLNGSVDIESKPMAGTTIHVRVPFGSEHITRRAAG